MSILNVPVPFSFRGSAWYNPTSQGSRPSPQKVREPRTPFVPKGRTLRKAWRSLGSPTPDTAPWGRSPDLPVWRDGDRKRERQAHEAASGTPQLSFKAVSGRGRAPSVDSGSSHWGMALFFSFLSGSFFPGSPVLQDKLISAQYCIWVELFRGPRLPLQSRLLTQYRVPPAY